MSNNVQLRLPSSILLLLTVASSLPTNLTNPASHGGKISSTPPAASSERSFQISYERMAPFRASSRKEYASKLPRKWWIPRGSISYRSLVLGHQGSGLCVVAWRGLSDGFNLDTSMMLLANPSAVPARYLYWKVLYCWTSNSPSKDFGRPIAVSSDVLSLAE